jgi:hypothetical protein
MNNSSNNINKTGGTDILNTPLKLYQPLNLIVFLSFYSSIIIATVITSMSFIFQNFKGFIYLGFLLAACVIRHFLYVFSDATPSVNDGTICSAIQYSKYGNPSFNAFVSSFTTMYISFPMFANSSPNFWVFSILLVYLFLDIFIKFYKGCFINKVDLFLNLLLGSTLSALFIIAMYSGNSGKYLFFNEVSSDKEICSMPKKQTFKCSLYKNGELISGPGN